MRYLTTFSLALGLLAATPRIAEACMCGESDYVAAYAESAYVFRGRVTGVDGDVGRFEVLGYYKGKGPREVHLRAIGAGMCRHRFEVGTEYLVFSESHLSIGFCGGSFKIRVGEQRWGQPESQVVAVLEEVGASDMTPPGEGPALHPLAKPQLDPKFVAAHEGPPFDPDVDLEADWPKPTEAPQAPGASAAAKVGPPPAKTPAATEAAPQASSGCMGRIAPEKPSRALAFILLAGIARRRRAPDRPSEPRELRLL